MARIRLESIGCRLNTGEMEALARDLAVRGHRVVAPGEPADLCIFNTCTVTAAASGKSRKALRRLRRAHPEATMVATGCYAEMDPETVADLGMDLVVGNRDKDRLIEILEARGVLGLPQDDPFPLKDVGTEFLGPLSHRRTRAFVKVQDGCDNACAFCIVTVARGVGRSLPLDAVIDRVGQLAAGGFKEFVLSGVHLGSYGHDRGERDGLETLVRAVLDVGGVRRLRLSSIEPWDVRPSFFELFADPRLMPHLHLPLQSGCDATLRRMARKTTRNGYRKLIETARSAVPDVAISTDVLVGFPGETDEEFEESAAFIETMNFSHLHIFRFSIRPGTAAASMPRQVPDDIAVERSRRMHAIGADSEAAFKAALTGRTVEVLWERSEPFENGWRWTGLTPCAVRAVVETTGNRDLFNTITPTRIVDALPGHVVGRIEADSLPVVDLRR